MDVHRILGEHASQEDVESLDRSLRFGAGRKRLFSSDGLVGVVEEVVHLDNSDYLESGRDEEREGEPNRSAKGRRDLEFSSLSRAQGRTPC